MSDYLKLPIMFISFWFISAPKEILLFFGSLNHAFLQFFSLPLLARTFFKPIKNEYRHGLVGFSIGFGMVVKFVLIIFNIALFIPLLLGELVLFILFLSFPILTIAVLFL